MQKSSKIGFGLAAIAALVIGASYIAPNISKLKNFTTNLFFDVLFDRVHGPAKDQNGKLTGALRLFIRFNIRNFSGFSLAVNNVFATIESSADGKNWALVGYSPIRVDQISLPDGKTVSGTVPVDVKPGLLTSLYDKKVKYRVVTTYEFKGIQQRVESAFDLTAQRDSIITSIKKTFGFGAVDYSQSKNLLI